MTKPNSINMGTKEDINILLNSDEELKYNISRLAMILADLQNKKQKEEKLIYLLESMLYIGLKN